GNLSFATRIRAALKHAGIPTEIPAECLALRRYVEGHEVPDGPTAFAECRNRLMHPPKKKRGWPPGDVMKEAWKLGVEYLALLILAALGYTGTYRSQIDYSGWAGSERPVPWAL